MKVLLIQPPHYYDDGKTSEPHAVPLGLGYVAKALLNSGNEVEVLDIWAHQYSDEEVKQIIVKLDYDICGIGAFSTQYAYVKWLISELKKLNTAPIVMGNALATFSPEIVLNNTKADICCIGEGEITFVEIIKNITDLGKVKGIYFKQNDKIIKNPPREYIKDLDSIDFPAWDLFPMDIYSKYLHVWGTSIKAFNLLTTRGCPYNCKFCSRTFSGVRYRSLDNILLEIKTLKEKYGIGGVFFHDELFIRNKKTVYDFCDKVAPLNLKWNCNGRINTVDLDLLKRMKEVGCVAVAYGVESGSQTILDNMDKNITVTQIENVIKNTLKAGMEPIMFMMYGYPGENKKTLQETADLFKKFPPTQMSVKLSITTPFPGSELYNYAVEKSLIKDEVQYIEQLAGGFSSGKHFINFTEFNNDEFYQLKFETEKKIFYNQVKRYPLHFIYKKLHNLSKAPAYAQSFGYKQLIVRIIGEVRKIIKSF